MAIALRRSAPLRFHVALVLFESRGTQEISARRQRS